jgi:hypothetical protein
MIGGELIEQLALHVGAGEAAKLLLDLALDQFAQLIDSLEAKALGKIVVDRRILGHLHRLDDDVEGCRLSGEALLAIIGGERDIERPALADLDAFELGFETGDQPACAKLDRHVFARAAREGDAVGGLADEIDDDLVTVDRGVALLRVGEALLARREAADLRVDLFDRRLDRQPLEAQPLDRRGRNLRKHFERDLDLDILAGLEFFGELDRRLHRRAQSLFGDQSLNAFLDAGVERFALQRRAVHLLDQIRRHLAGAEARHADSRGGLLDLGFDLGSDILGGDLERVSALQALVQRLDSLHILLSRTQRW